MKRLRQWIGRLFRKRPGISALPPAVLKTIAAKPRPTREAILELPPFEGIGLERIVAVDSPDLAETARQELMRETVIGFDTESRPTFAKGELSTGPHVAQFATPRRTFVFLLRDPSCRRVAGELIGSAALTKVGFGLDSERRQIPKRLRVECRGFLDLEAWFRKRGHGRGIGVKVAVAIVFQRRFAKSRSATTSNWARHPLTSKQLLYAANDAYAALMVYRAMKP